MNKLFVLPLAVIAFAAACTDTATNPLSHDGTSLSESRGGVKAAGLAGNNGAASQVIVRGTFTVEIPGSGEIIRNAAGINEEGKPHGWCDEDGRWQNPSNKNWSNSAPHAHCTRGAEPRIVTWDLEAPATYVVNSNNVNLNFKDLLDHAVHFKGQQNRTDGQGSFLHSQDGGLWQLDLNDLDGAGNAFSACGANCLDVAATFAYGGTSYPATAQLSW